MCSDILNYFFVDYKVCKGVFFEDIGNCEEDSNTIYSVVILTFHTRLIEITTKFCFFFVFLFNIMRNYQE